MKSEREREQQKVRSLESDRWLLRAHPKNGPFYYKEDFFLLQLDRNEASCERA